MGPGNKASISHAINVATVVTRASVTNSIVTMHVLLLAVQTGLPNSYLIALLVV